VLLDLSVGHFPVAPAEIVDFLLAKAGLGAMPEARLRTLHTVLIDLRLPRVASAVLVGMALATAGAAFQAVFRNPLVSPGLLGVLGGAAFGGALGMVLDGSRILIEGLAFAMGLAAVGRGGVIGSVFGAASMVSLVLGGMISSALFAALLSMLKYIADPVNQLPAIVYWLMGNLGQADLGRVAWAAVPVLAGVIVLSVCGRALDALSMGDDEARAVGVPVPLIRYGVIAAATLVSALTVSLAGMVGWVGLIVPHLARLLLGPGNARLVPASALLGAAFLVLADAASRSVAAIEIPIGIVTEILGIPAFLLVLHRARRGWL
jgi:iron complex transport system permease protein